MRVISCVVLGGGCVELSRAYGFHADGYEDKYDDDEITRSHFVVDAGPSPCFGLGQGDSSTP